MTTTSSTSPSFPPEPHGSATPDTSKVPSEEPLRDGDSESMNDLEMMNASAALRPPRRTLMDRLDAFVSRLSTRSNFWHRVCSIIWLPYAARSGIKMKRVDEHTFSAVLPFTRFNKNWYNAMAGAALLGNSEIAAGMYVFGFCGGDYTVVCRHLEYRFLRPCLGPAIYRITPRENIQDLLSSKREFNVTLDMDILQQFAGRKKGREHRVGRCVVEFHVTPKTQVKARMERRQKER
ncbi:MAG TPA: hypothetical protein VK176_10370 [Phycisphaerales bacterium]|nr:hypothetical protein [Phycisphaerales bacterium]